VPAHPDNAQSKDVVREHVWALLENENAAPLGVRGSIPAFHGAELAADRLAQHPAWDAANVVKAVPDKAQHPVRARALREGKLVYMAVPKLAEPEPFYFLDPARITVSPEDAATSKVAHQIARTLDVSDMRPVDLVVCGSVAVNRDGVRIGKGAGYSDIEVAILCEAGLIGPQTTIVTTVHSLQVVDGPLPETEHDFGVDVIVTPEEIIECPRRDRSYRIIWEHLTPSKVEKIPLLRKRWQERSSTSC